MEIQEIEVSKLNAAKYNPRKMSDSMLNKLEKSIKEFGIVEPLIVNQRDNKLTVVGGHQRLKVCEMLGMEKVPCYIVHLDKTKEKALNIALNKITGEFDEIKLLGVLEDMKLELPDIEITGFELPEIEKIENDVLEESEQSLLPYKKTHILISFPPEKMVEIQDVLEEIVNKEFVEYEQSSN